MNIRAFFGRGREFLGRMLIKESARNPSGTFSLLALRLERDLPRQNRGRSVFVVTADDDAAGVEATMELAWCLAEELGHAVLLVDGVFDGQSLSAALGAADKAGLAELICAPTADHCTLEGTVQPTAHPRIAMLPRGSDNGERVTRVESVRNVLMASCEKYDFVLVLGSILVEGSRSLAFSSLVDAALLVAVEEQTTVDHVNRGKRILNDCGAARVALVLANRPQARRSNGR